MQHRARWLLVVVVWIGFIGVSLFLLEHSEYGGGDFRLYYVAAHDYLPEKMPYISITGVQPDMLNYPPLLPQLLMPLAKTFDLQTTMRVWFGLSVAALLGMVAALSRFVRPSQRFTLWLAAGLFAPCFEALRIGQVNVVLMALIGFAWAAAKANRRTLAGILLAAAAWVKIYPALILLYFLWKRDWQAVRGGVIGALGLGLFQVAVSGAGVMIEFFRSLLLVSGQSESHLLWKNSSIYGFAAKLFLNAEHVDPLLISPTLFTITRFGLSAFVLLALFYLSAKSPSHGGDTLKDNQRFDLEYGLAVLTMLLVSPWLYADSIAPILIVGFILWRRGQSLTNRALLGLVGALITANYLLMWQRETSFHALVLSVGFYALVILWSMTVGELRHRPAITMNG